MAETSGPFDYEPGVYEGMYQDEYEPMAQGFVDDGVKGDQGGARLQVYISGSEARLRAGEAYVRGIWYRNDAEIAFEPAENTSGNARLDRIVLRLDRVTKKILAAQLEGTPASSPTAPALTQSTALDGVWEQKIGGYKVEAGSSLPTNAFDERTFIGLRLWRPSDVSLLPTVNVPRWQPAVLPDGSKREWDGSSWASTPANVPAGLGLALGGVPVTGLSSSAFSRRLTLNKRVIIDAGLIVATSTGAGSVGITGLPAPAFTAGDRIVPSCVVAKIGGAVREGLSLFWQSVNSKWYLWQNGIVVEAEGLVPDDAVWISAAYEAA